MNSAVNRSVILGCIAALFLLCAFPAAAQNSGKDFGAADPARETYIRLIIEDPDPVGKLALVRRFAEHLERAVRLGGGEDEDQAAYDVSRVLTVRSDAGKDSGTTILLSAFVGGSWSEPIRVAEESAAAKDPVVLVDPASGAVHVLYWVDDDAPRVRHVHAPADLSSWSRPTTLSRPAEVAVRPSGVFHGGELHVIYEAHNGAVGGGPALLVHAVGGSSEVVALAPHAGASRPVLRSVSGDLLALWREGDATVAWSRLPASGAWGPVFTAPAVTADDLDAVLRMRLR